MGRTLAAVHSIELTRLFAYFGLEARPEVVAAHRAAIRSRFDAEVGFASFRHHCEERLGLPARTVEQRAALEEKLSTSPALTEARRQGLSYEKLRALSRLSEQEIGSWTPRAHALTCLALRRRLDDEEERQMCAATTDGWRVTVRPAHPEDSLIGAGEDGKKPGLRRTSGRVPLRGDASRCPAPQNPADVV